jgi:chorismate mutase
MIIQTHYDPDNSLGDAAQQVTPTALKQIFIDLIRKVNICLVTTHKKKMKIKS